MPPKKAGGKSSNFYKAGTQIKDVIPPSEKNPPRDGKPLKQIDATQQIPREVLFEKFEEVTEWPGDDQALAFDFQLNGTQPFQEQNTLQKDFLKLRNRQDSIIFWRRPQDYIKDEEEQKVEIEKMIQVRRRQSFTQQPNFLTFGNQNKDSEFLKDDSEVYRKQDFKGDENDMGESQQQQQQQQQQHEQKKIEIKVCDIFDREETQQEMEDRLKEAEIKAQDPKAKKKQPKKNEEQEGPQKIKDCKLSNIDMSYKLLDDCKWLASQLQIIKDRNLRDVQSNKPIWSKIYPQQDGVPVYNPTGRYWVKLYFMGKERKIEIDDKMPVDVDGQSYFPKSVKKEELWASLLTKAIIKLYCLTDNIDQTQNNLTGSGFVIYSLTGMLSETIKISPDDREYNKKTFEFLKEMLNDQQYNKNDIFVTCFCEPDFKPSAESNLKREIKEYYIDQIRPGYQELAAEEDSDELQQHQQQNNYEGEFGSPIKNNSQLKQSFIPESMDSPMKIKKKMKIDRQETLKDKPTYVIPGFAYSLWEGFFNNNFNMVYVQKRSDKEVKLRQDYFELSKVTMHKFTKDEKLEHRRKKKELREKISECDRSRVELITKPPNQFKLFRIKTNAARCPLLNIQCPFTNEEINIAKTCIANNLSKPPNYELPEVRDDGKSMISNMKNQEETFAMKPLDDFSALHNMKYPPNRGQGGIWVQDSDLIGCFQYIQLYYNPKKLDNNQNIHIPSNPDQEITINKDNELLIVHAKKDEDGELLDEDIRLIVGFQPQNAVNKQFCPAPFTILQKFDFDIFDTVHDYEPLRLKQQAQCVNFKNDNTLFKLMTYSPLSYNLNIACDSKFDTMSIPQYLMDYENYHHKQFVIDYPSFEENKYTNIVRFRFNPCEQDSTFIVKINSTTDNNMLKYFRYKILEELTQGESYMLQTLEGVHKNQNENSLVMQPYFRQTLQKNKKYYFLLEGVPPYNTQEGQLECDFYLQNESQQIEQIEMVEPLEYTDRYLPTKYGILFREKLFSDENSIASVFLRLAQVEGAAVQAQGDKKGKGPAQGDIQEKPMDVQRLIKLEFFENDQLIQYSYGYNQALLSNLVLQANKDDHVTYYLQASFDLREWEGCKDLNEDTQSIQWFLKVQSSDTIGVVKDTVKEDREKSIIKSWEEQQPGRATKAKTSRQKFLLYKKQQNGEELTEEELAILQEPRVSKKLREEEQGGKGAKKTGKKEDKKAAKKGGKEVEEEKKEERPVPESQSHVMKQIFEFLSHMEEERIKDQLAKHQGLINTRDDENKKEIKENAQLTLEELEGLLERNRLVREQLNELQQEQKQQILEQLQKTKNIYKDQWEAYYEQREKIKNSLQEKTTKEKELLDICSQEKPQIAPEQLEKQIEELKEIPDINKNMIELGYQVLKNVKIQALNEKFTQALQIFEVETLKACMQEYTEMSVTGIDSEIIEQAETMLQEAADNPNYQAEKAAELKKAGKKGKK